MDNVNTPKQAIEQLIGMGFTQAKIADVSRVPQGTISRIARGEHKDPRHSTAQKIFTAFKRIAISTDSVVANNDERS